MNIALNTSPTDLDLPMICYTDKKQERFSSNYYAPMEEKTLKIRHKLEQRLNQIDQQITEEKLSLTKQKIHAWIDRHSKERVVVKKASLHLFTGGLTSAPLSPKLSGIREQLRAGFYAGLDRHGDLRGRVKK